MVWCQKVQTYTGLCTWSVFLRIPLGINIGWCAQASVHHAHPSLSTFLRWDPWDRSLGRWCHCHYFQHYPRHWKFVEHSVMKHFNNVFAESHCIGSKLPKDVYFLNQVPPWNTIQLLISYIAFFKSFSMLFSIWCDFSFPALLISSKHA